MEGSIKQGLSRRRNPNFQPIRSHRVCQDSIWASRSCRNLGSGTSGHQLEVLTLLTACILKKWKWVEFWYKFLKLVVIPLIHLLHVDNSTGGNMVGYTKLFHAADFVHKHVRLKHLDLVMDLTSKVREELYFYNYMNDTDAPGGQPVMQQPLPRDMPQRDDRGNHHRRDQERIDRNGGGGGDDERFDKTENSPSRDVQSNTTGGGGDPDEPIYDTYGGAGGSGLHGAQFPSDLAPPPPVLMHVPGAGPLGPFVPAPPEVAMRMLREQGGGPFEGTVARNGRVGPTPIIAVSPAFQPDPRRVRSYRDLDAPEDEVTLTARQWRCESHSGCSFCKNSGDYIKQCRKCVTTARCGGTSQGCQISELEV
ncbi:hypothetical protein C5167_041939 [Papaver somniferum]|nr:hypothetical protein C5167_041939 [Papaver somniferum]